MMAFVMFTPGDQPEIVPPSPAKMNALAPLTPPWLTANADEPLNTIPVGLAGPATPAGIETTSDCGVPLLATQTKPCGLNAMPQALTRFRSAFDPLYGLLALLMFDTNDVATKPVLAVVMPVAPPLPPPPHDTSASAPSSAEVEPRII